MDLNFDCETSSITSCGKNYISVKAEGVLDKSQILNSFSIRDILEYWDSDELLDEIGAERASQYFNLVPNTEKD